MLNSISWQQYITAVLLLAAAWYAYVGLKYYHTELMAFLKVKPKERSAMPPVATAVMGSIQGETDTGSFDPEQLQFSNAQSDEISEQTLPKGPSDDLLAEAEALVAAYADNDDKPGFLSLLQMLLNKYEVFADEISLPAVIKSLKHFASPKLPFTIQDAEWPVNF